MIRKMQFLAVLGLALGAPARAADVTVLGCNEMLPGEIGVRELVGDVGDTVGVAVTVHTTGDVDAFGLDIAFPTNLLSYVRTDLGELVAAWPIASGTLKPAQGLVRIGGLNGTPIPAGVSGRLAVMFFVVETAGAGSFATVGLVDDLAGYTPCESVHTPTKIERKTWGAVKDLYK
jgi:hypothetical protein